MEGQVSIFDINPECDICPICHPCKDCKHSYKRSEFDLADKGKWAYEYACTLSGEYRQVCQTCDKWEKEDG